MPLLPLLIFKAFVWLGGTLLPQHGDCTQLQQQQQQPIVTTNAFCLFVFLNVSESVIVPCICNCHLTKFQGCQIGKPKFSITGISNVQFLPLYIMANDHG